VNSPSSSRLIGGRFTVLRLLAESGTGRTFLAWDLQGGSLVMLKPPQRVDYRNCGQAASDSTLRFTCAVKTFRSLAHDHIIPLVDPSDEAGIGFVAFKFLPGGTLADHRRPHSQRDFRPTPPGTLHFWLPPIAQALDFIHSQGVVHGDVRPANILFDGFRNAFLSDFGFKDDGPEDPGIRTATTHFAARPEFATPGCFTPRKPTHSAAIDHRADQYALALTVYELLFGQGTLGDTLGNLWGSPTTSTPSLLERHSPGLPSSLAEAVRRALSKNPEEWFASCAEFAVATLADVPPQRNELDVVWFLCPGCNRFLRVRQATGGSNRPCSICSQPVTVANDLPSLWLQKESTMVRQQTNFLTPRRGGRPARRH
jgi:serine/threonine protein kinase